MVTIDPNNTKFDMGELRLDKDPIISDEFSVDLTTENEAKNSTSSRDPYRYAGGNNEYEWSASGVALEFEDQLIEAKLNRTSFPSSE